MVTQQRPDVLSTHVRNGHAQKVPKLRPIQIYQPILQRRFQLGRKVLVKNQPHVYRVRYMHNNAVWTASRRKVKAYRMWRKSEKGECRHTSLC